jgi:hypothetical protein
MKPWNVAARVAMRDTISSVEGRKAVEDVRPGERMVFPFGARMAEAERSGVLFEG